MPELSRAHIDAVTAHQMALGLLYKAGFLLANASMTTESHYFYHPARGLDFRLRVSIHKAKPKGIIGLSGFVSRATFSPQVAHSEWHVHNTVAMAIGRYFMAAAPPASRYDGPRMETPGAPPADEAGNSAVERLKLTKL